MEHFLSDESVSLVDNLPKISVDEIVKDNKFVLQLLHKISMTKNCANLLKEMVKKHFFTDLLKHFFGEIQYSYLERFSSKFFIFQKSKWGDSKSMREINKEIIGSDFKDVLGEGSSHPLCREYSAHAEDEEYEDEDEGNENDIYSDKLEIRHQFRVKIMNEILESRNEYESLDRKEVEQLTFVGNFRPLVVNSDQSSVNENSEIMKTGCFGIQIFPNLDFYIGTYENNRFHGLGLYYYHSRKFNKKAEGSSSTISYFYLGQWKNDRRNEKKFECGRYFNVSTNNEKEIEVKDNPRKSAGSMKYAVREYGIELEDIKSYLQFPLHYLNFSKSLLNELLEKKEYEIFSKLVDSRIKSNHKNEVKYVRKVFLPLLITQIRDENVINVRYLLENYPNEISNIINEIHVTEIGACECCGTSLYTTATYESLRSENIEMLHLLLTFSPEVSSRIELVSTECRERREMGRRHSRSRLRGNTSLVEYCVKTGKLEHLLLLLDYGVVLPIHRSFIFEGVSDPVEDFLVDDEYAFNHRYLSRFLQNNTTFDEEEAEEIEKEEREVEDEKRRKRRVFRRKMKMELLRKTFERNVWDESVHRVFPKGFRDAVFTCLCCNHYGSDVGVFVPIEIWRIVFSFIPYYSFPLLYKEKRKLSRNEIDSNLFSSNSLEWTNQKIREVKSLFIEKKEELDEKQQQQQEEEEEEDYDDELRYVDELGLMEQSKDRFPQTITRIFELACRYDLPNILQAFLTSKVFGCPSHPIPKHCPFKVRESKEFLNDIYLQGCYLCAKYRNYECLLLLFSFFNIYPPSQSGDNNNSNDNSQSELLLYAFLDGNVNPKMTKCLIDLYPNDFKAVGHSKRTNRTLKTIIRNLISTSMFYEDDKHVLIHQIIEKGEISLFSEKEIVECFILRCLNTPTLSMMKSSTTQTTTSDRRYDDDQKKKKKKKKDCIGDFDVLEVFLGFLGNSEWKNRTYESIMESCEKFVKVEIDNTNLSSSPPPKKKMKKMKKKKKKRRVVSEIRKEMTENGKFIVDFMKRNEITVIRKRKKKKKKKDNNTRSPQQKKKKTQPSSFSSSAMKITSKKKKKKAIVTNTKIPKVDLTIPKLPRKPILLFHQPKKKKKKKNVSPTSASSPQKKKNKKKKKKKKKKSVNTQLQFGLQITSSSSPPSPTATTSPKKKNKKKKKKGTKKKKQVKGK